MPADIRTGAKPNGDTRRQEMQNERRHRPWRYSRCDIAAGEAAAPIPPDYVKGERLGGSRSGRQSSSNSGFLLTETKQTWVKRRRPPCQQTFRRCAAPNSPCFLTASDGRRRHLTVTACARAHSTTCCTASPVPQEQISPVETSGCMWCSILHGNSCIKQHPCSFHS